MRFYGDPGESRQVPLARPRYEKEDEALGIQQSAEYDEIKSVILTGAGRAFCAGAGLKAVAKRENREKNPSRFTFMDKV